MKFGIEIEYIGPTAELIEALAVEGLGQRRGIHSYIGHDERYWIVKLDGSVGGGGELVSPPLNFDDPEQREQVTRAVKVMQRVGCKPDQRAGIHVHIESRGMTPKEISAVARLFARYEDILYRLASSGWRSVRYAAQTYARPLSEKQKVGLARAKTNDQLMKAYYGDDPFRQNTTSHSNQARYCGLNLHSHWYRGTIEFRVFNSSVNPERIQMYIAICAAFIRDAKKGKLRSIGKGAAAMGAMQNMDEEEIERLFFNFISVMRYQADIDIEDYRRIKKFWKDSRPQAPIPAMR